VADIDLGGFGGLDGLDGLDGLHGGLECFAWLASSVARVWFLSKGTPPFNFISGLTYALRRGDPSPLLWPKDAMGGTPLP
jgi:hypothetical protein